MIAVNKVVVSGLEPTSVLQETSCILVTVISPGHFENFRYGEWQYANPRHQIVECETTGIVP